MPKSQAMTKKYTLTWIGIFLILLTFIPVLSYFKYFAAAKVIGVTTVLTISIAIRIWTRKSKSAAVNKERIVLNRNDMFWLNVAVPNYKNLSKEDQKTFVHRMGLFLSTVPIGMVHEGKPEREEGLAIAAHFTMAHLQEPFLLPEAELIMFTRDSHSEALSLDAINLDLENWDVESAKLIWSKL